MATTSTPYKLYHRLVKAFLQEFESNKKLRSTDALLYIYLVETCRENGWKSPFELRNSQINKALKITDKMIGESRKRLEAEGFIEATPGDRWDKTPTYHIRCQYFSVESKTESKTESKIEHITADLQQVAEAKLPQNLPHTCLEEEKEQKETKEKESLPPAPPSKKKKKKIKKEKEEASAAEPDDENDDVVIDFDVLQRFYNDELNKAAASIPRIRSLTDQRKAAAKARAREYGKPTVAEMIRKAAASNFLNGDNHRGFIADFDWLFRPNNFLKVIEGNYDNRLLNPTPLNSNSYGSTTINTQHSEHERQLAFQRRIAAKLAGLGPKKPDVSGNY